EAEAAHGSIVSDLRPRSGHHPARAKSVIHLFMNGGPSQMDLFDPKPALDRLHGKSYFERIAGEVENPTAAGAILRSPFRFAPHGESGMEISELLPHLARHADDLALLRGMYTDNLTHEPALYQAHCGRMLPGLPTIGAWVSYGLGTENQNLPAYVVLDDPRGLPINRTQNWQSGFLPPVFQGTRFRATGSPVLHLAPEYDEPSQVRRRERGLISELDKIHRATREDLRLDARIASYELAARMQLEASDALDLRQEPKATLERYGIGREPTDSYGRRCLIARRLVERGVRFVQLFIDGQIWDHHTGIEKGLKSACARTDQPTAALLFDLKERGLLDETLVVWGGEFGRLPIAQLGGDKSTKNAGRDHNKNAMVTWMAGGGVRGGAIHGATDELGFSAVEGRVSIQSWHATMLHLLGLDARRLAFPRNGLEEKLIGTADVEIVREILANG
ncbi:MAG: DUF1501 domain-containing protein, partial [Planctomycetota bacterium]